MGKLQFCRICRTETNLKYTAKELRQLNKKQLQLAQGTQAQAGQATDRASKKLLLTTLTLGNICRVCDERIQIFHHLDDGDHDSGSDIEIDVVEATNNALPARLVNRLPNGESQQRQRSDSPVIVDDDDMLYNIFMQKVDQQRQLKSQHVQQLLPQQPQQNLQLQPQIQQQFVPQFQSPYTPPQSTAGGSEGDESKTIDLLTSRESTPASSIPIHVPTPPAIVDQFGHRIVAIIDLDDDDDVKSTEGMLRESAEKDTGLLTPLTNSSNDLSIIEPAEKMPAFQTPVKNNSQTNKTSLNTIQNNAKSIADDDDEEIIFRRVDPEQTPTSSTKKRKRKSYDEKQLRLVASLNLVSSDSENEDSPTKSASKKPLTSGSACKESVNVQKRFTCKTCNISLPDAESLSVHERIHQGVKCPLCQFGFSQVHRLIHHMRYKHREYNGDVLSEKPRVGQDSCMTIRLRYMQRTTFYECQLCGRIDEIFREHKEHIIDKHPIESKSLKDPMMKQLKCPVCKVKCGAQYLSLCRHLISNHEHQEFKGHLRELVHVSAFGWNASRQQEVAKTAKIFQFHKRKTFFFECKICQKVVAGYLHHLRHLQQHKTTTTTTQKTKVTTTTTSEVNIPCSSSTRKICPPAVVAKPKVLKKLPEKVEKSKRKTRKLKVIEKEKSSLKKSKIIAPTKKSQKLKTSLRLETPLKSDKFKHPIKPKQHQRKTESVTKLQQRKSVEPIKKLQKQSIEPKKKLQIKIKLKPKDQVNLPTIVKKTKGRPKKIKDIQIKKVKVKPTVRQIDLQTYKCNYCLKRFKGFRIFNLHLLQQHNENKYTKCNKCNKIFSSASLLQQHIKQCCDDPNLHATNKQKRKFIANSLNQDECDNKRLKTIESCENFTRQVPNNIGNSIETLNVIQANQDQWIEDLIKLNESSKTSDSSLTCSSSSHHITKTNTALFIPQKFNVPCCYCLHLFASKDDLEQHTKQQHLQKQEILIKYKPITPNIIILD